ncbi:50S ribosomal protein L40e [Candidatus Woesearchaeota archaeon]|nr:MAG: 50S ribosomal protein L40e [Candidatus Woesearchaeota archaeon]
MAKFPEAEARKFKNMYVCRKCKAKRRAPTLKVLAGKVTCRKCGYDILRPVRRK